MKRFSLILVSFLLTLAPVTAIAEHAIFHHSVLIIHSYHPSMQWVKELQQGIDNEMLKEMGHDIDLKIEYMDSKRYTSPSHFTLLAELWSEKYKNNPPDCIIVCDDNALNLVLQLRKKIFKNIPLVFCGINFYDKEQFSSIDNITGVVEAYDLEGTLSLIKRLFPARDKLFIINDDTTTGKANKARLEEIAYDYSRQYSFMYSGNVSTSILESVVQTLKDDTVILLMSFNRDSENQTLRYRDAVRTVRTHSSQPIFGVWSFYLGKGIIGGSLVNGQSQGQKAAELAIEILRGKKPSDLPVITESPNLRMFDYKELQRFKISRSILPQDSKIINTPNTPWHRHKYKILAGIFLLLFQTVIIALLIYNVFMRKKSQLNLLKNQQNLTITLEAIAEAVISVNSSYKIIRVNSAAATLLDTHIKDLPGKSMPELLKDKYAKAGDLLTEVIIQCCQSGKNVALPEKTVLKLEGSPAKHLSGTCSPIRGENSSIIGAVLICHDITERESMRAMLAHSQKMEAIGQLAGGVAHDFNNLLAGISGFAEILSIQLQDDEQKLAHTQKILNAAGRAKDLTRQLLSFARKGKVISTALNCHEALLSSIALLERSLDKRINLKTQLTAEQSTILGDPVQLENLFLNLGINSADAMEKGGTLTFSTANVVIDDSIICEFGETIEPGKYLTVSVKDTGSGIDPESRQHIFEPFYTTKKSGKGTGLGLSAVFGAIKEHSGKLQLFSEPGTGTEFKLYFPLTEKNMVQTSDNTPLERGSGSILLIDDESLVLSSATALLNELGYTTFSAKGGQDGIDIYTKHHENIDLVILDMIMPEMDGSSCFAALKEINPLVKVIISSGFASPTRVKEVEKLGAKAFLQKPYSASSLSNAVSKLIRS